METSSFSGKSSSSKSEAWRQLETGSVCWDELSANEREEVVKRYAPKIKFIALRLKAKLPASVELGELLSAGSLGLIESLKKYRPDQGVKFETYAEARIKGAMLDDLRRLDFLSRGARQQVRRLEEASRRIENQTGRPPDAVALAKELGVSVREAEQGLEALHSQVVLSLDAMQDGDGLSQLTSGENEPYKIAARTELVGKLAQLIEGLTPREKLVLSLYYSDELNMRETAEVMDITEGRVSQLHSQALAKLKKSYVARFGA